jgi:hypothetical protein
LCLKALIFAFDSRQPSRIEAWSPEQRADRRQIGLMAGREDERRFGVEPLGELLLERHVQIDGAVQEARAGQAGPVFEQRRLGRLLDALIARQPQIVVGPEHDPGLALHLDDRERRALQHAEVGKRVDRARHLELLEPLVLSRLGEDVDRGGHLPVDRNERPFAAPPSLSTWGDERSPAAG